MAFTDPYFWLFFRMKGARNSMCQEIHNSLRKIIRALPKSLLRVVFEIFPSPAGSRTVATFRIFSISFATVGSICSLALVFRWVEWEIVGYVLFGCSMLLHGYTT